jgi:2-iminobutanoate/2-iminopropanoate deaminase
VSRRPRSLNVPHVGHKAPIPLGARVGRFIASSGIAGKDPATGALPADAAAQAANAFANMAALLEAGGASPADVLKLSITVHDDGVREALNAPWLAAFPDPADRPARHVVVHPLQHGMLLQIELLAVASSD